jgi:hypothetical protein
VLPETVRYVVSVIGADRLKASSADEHLNDIPLVKWDGIRNSLPIQAPNDQRSFSISEACCISKEAARQYLDSLEVAD